MKHILTIVFYALILGWQPGTLKLQALKTPELFGDANAVMLYSDHDVHGLIINKDFGGIITGTVQGNEVSCRIMQISGEAVQGINQFVPCYAIVKDTKWTGWISFRGHHRKMCGAESIGQLPATCRLEEK